jgi:hypothetical protein
VPINVVKIDPTNSQVVYVGTGMFYASSYDQDGGIYKSVDGGQNWSTLLTDVVVNSIQIDPSNPNIIYAGCGTGGAEYRGFYKSVDGGSTWENKEFVSSAITDIKINSGRTNTLYAATYRQGMYMSIDAGENWENIGLTGYYMFDLSVYETSSVVAYGSSLRSSLAQESSVNIYAGTNSGVAGFTGSSISGYIYNSTGSATVHPTSVWLDVSTGQINGSVFDTGTYLILNPPAGNNYTLHCIAEGYPETQITGVSVGAMSELYYDFYLDSPSNPLFFPHIDTSNGWETEIAVINTSSTQTSSGTLNAYSNQGQLIDTIGITLAPHARRQIIVSQKLSNPSSIDYLIFNSDIDEVKGYSKLYKDGIYRVATPAASVINTSDIYVSHIASDYDWWTKISLVNTTDTQKTLTLTFSTGEISYITIPARGSNTATIRDLFGGPKQDIKSAVITNASGIVGVELFGSTDESIYNYLSGILLKDSTTTTIYYPHIDSSYIDSSSYWWTGIVAYSPPGYSSNIAVSAYDQYGNLLETAYPPTIEPNGKYIGSVASLELAYATAWLKIDSDNPITGFELFGTQNGNQLGGYTGVNIAGREGVFAKIEKQGWTGIAFVNIESSQASIQLTAYDDNGTVIATQPITLASFAKQVEQPVNIFIQDISSATYISYSSDRDIVAFQLNGSGDMLLDGLEGM